MGNRETVLMCLYQIKVQTRLSRDQRPTKPVNRLVAVTHIGQVRSECITAYSEQAVVVHACHGHRYWHLPVPLSGTGITQVQIYSNL